MHAQVVVELKNDLAIGGTLHSVDQFLNVKLINTHVINESKYPHMVSGCAFVHGLQHTAHHMGRMRARLAPLMTAVAAPAMHVAVGAQLLHPRQRGPLHSVTSQRSGRGDPA